MKLFSKNPFKLTAEKLIALSLVVAVFGALVAPRAVEASFAEALKEKYDDFFLSTGHSFPVSEER